MSWTDWQVQAPVTGSARSADEAPSLVSCDTSRQIEIMLPLSIRQKNIETYSWRLTDTFYIEGSRIEEEEGYNEEEMSYLKQGEDALQKAISILSEQDGWTIETLAVSSETHRTEEHFTEYL